MVDGVTHNGSVEMLLKNSLPQDLPPVTLAHLENLVIHSRRHTTVA
jgi:hypothetical protein